MLLILDPGFWKWAAVLAVIHLMIDVVKLYAINEKRQRRYFFIDQAVHLVLIYIIWLVYQGNAFPLQNLHFDNLLLWITAVYALTTPTSISIKFFISRWSPQTLTQDGDSLQEAGTWIGILERFFVFAFIVFNHWEGIGFLLAAKSIFRFGDLKESKDRKLTEYVLIGTLLSFGIAMLTGIAFENLISHTIM